MDPLTLLALATTALAMGRQLQSPDVDYRQEKLDRAWARVLRRPDVQRNAELMVVLDRMLEQGLTPPGFVWISGSLVEVPNIAELEHDPSPPTYIQVFYVDADEFYPGDDGSWMSERIRERMEDDGMDVEFDYGPDLPEEIEELQQEYEGWYYWHSLPGSMPDSDAYGPFETAEDASADAWEIELEALDDFFARNYAMVDIHTHDDGTASFSLKTDSGTLESSRFPSRLWAEVAVYRLGMQIEDRYGRLAI
jgi:hypothetical protein